MDPTVTVQGVITFIFGLISMHFINKHLNKRSSTQTPNKEQSIPSDATCNDCNPSNPKKPVRIYVDGCWDVMHSGHYNAIRQAKALGDILVVGVHSDAEIARNKREPVMKNEQRMAAVQACKWADEVVFDVPYAPSVELLDKLNCDYVAHGDDIPIAANGHSAYDTVKDRLKIFRRTPGVSTTHLIQRLIDAAKSNETHNFLKSDEEKTVHIESTSSWSSFLASSSRISAFSNNRTPTKNDTVIYIDGVFDLFHIGHISALRKAKELGTFLYVGLYDDETVRARKGKYFPLMNLQERVLNVLSCKYVDDVLIGAPWKITKQVLKSLNVKYVILTKNTLFAENELDRYQVPRELEMFKEVDTGSAFTTDSLMKNIVEQQDKLEAQNQNRVQKAKQYVSDYTYIQEAN